MHIVSESDSQIVVAHDHELAHRILGWVILAPMSIGLVLLLVLAFVASDGAAVVASLIGAVFVAPFVLIGMWAIGTRIEIAIDGSLGSVTIKDRTIPLYLWFRRTKVAPWEQRKSTYVYIESVRQRGVDEFVYLKYTEKPGDIRTLVRVGPNDERNREIAKHLAQRIAGGGSAQVERHRSGLDRLADRWIHNLIQKRVDKAQREQGDSN